MTQIADKLKPEGIAGQDFISWSQLTTYRQCPLRYHFRYVERLPPDFITDSLLFGGAFHAAVEHHHRMALEHGSQPILDELLDAFWNEWNRRTQDIETIKYSTANTVVKIGDLAERMLIAFQRSEFSDIEGHLVGIEEEFRGNVIAGCPDLLAHVDLIIDHRDEFVLRDYKTSRSRWSQATAESSAEQLLLYSELVSDKTSQENMRLEFVIITKTKSPIIQSFPIDAHAERVEKAKRIVQRIVRTIKSGEVYPNPSPLNCASCPYQKACAAWNG